MRNPKDDVMARSMAESRLSDQLEQLNLATGETADQKARDLIGTHKAVEFERTVSKVRGGAEVPLRRLVITSAWEVDPTTGLAEGWNAGQTGGGKSVGAAE